MIHHTCPSCNEKLTNSEAASGMELSCPHCRGRIRVPDAPSASASAADDMALALKVALARAEGQLPPLSPADPDSQPGKTRKWVILALVPLVSAGLAWLLAGTLTWKIIGAFGIALFVGMAMGLVGRLFKGFPYEPGTLSILGYLGLVLGTWFGVGYWFQVGQVHVDNFSSQELQVQLDGQSWLTCRPGTTTVENLSPGGHQITVRDAQGKTVQELSVEVERQGVYVLNLLRAQVYHKGEAQYGGIAFGDDAPKQINDAWFDAKVDCLFEKPPEKISVSSRRGQPVSSTSRTYLLRGPAPRKKEER